MYEHFRSSERVFVDREEHLDWMSEALKQCNQKIIVLYLHGIGGFGRSSLLDHWALSIEATIRFDCNRYTEFYSRLNMIAQRAMRFGVLLSSAD
ncbi:MAG: hypothetical protein ACXADF_13585 [Candidatus Thorarchaeota archaeon]